MTSEPKQILLVDDEVKFLDTIAQRLHLMGFAALKASSGQEALTLAKTHSIDLAIVDLKMPDMDGLVTIAKLKEIHPELRTVLLTGYGNEKIKQATESLDSAYFEKDEMGGLWDLIQKLNTDGNVVIIRPPASSRLTGGIARAQNVDSRQIEIRPSRYDEIGTGERQDNKAGIGTEDLPRLIGETEAMQQLRRNIKRLAALDCTVIIRGETGTGKELVARRIHNLSSRKNDYFLAINCGCFSNDLFFGELFNRTAGLWVDKGAGGGKQHGTGGTILLDQIEDMPVQMQSQLVQTMDRNRVSRVDGTGQAPFNARILVATQQDLGKLVDAKRFREDLYYRLNLMSLYIPPLRERREDIPPLCSYFINKISREFNKDVQGLSEEVIFTFMNYHFPGNIRELIHVIERAVIIAGGKTIELKHLPERFQKGASSPMEAKREFPTLAEMETRYIMEVLEATGGNKTRASEVLGISRAALWRKLKSVAP